MGLHSGSIMNPQGTKKFIISISIFFRVGKPTISIKILKTIDMSMNRIGNLMRRSFGQI